MSNLTQSKNIQDDLTLLAQKVDSTYKEGLYVYTEAVANYALEIEELKSQIKLEKKLNEIEEIELSNIKRDRDHEERFLEKLNETFNQKIHSINELKTEYADLMEQNNYEKILRKKKSELQLALDELEEVEITLLQQELEHINLLKILAPKRKNIVQLEEKLKKLELQKEFYSLKNLQQLPQLVLETSDEITTEVIEEDSLESNKS
ncbi:MAG: Myosin heavy chain [uncultured Sulfurovum sp.]|uniref:Myosin heavy chain n=1 Tax=uncultured Sulfurovum sp. TaxID=269237 RepID=A0A6S6ST03_9BACT|nr:MAG: Myosin heavy chain [uncultured Sulfurovum sp.]